SRIVFGQVNPYLTVPVELGDVESRVQQMYIAGGGGYGEVIAPSVDAAGDGRVAAKFAQPWAYQPSFGCAFGSQPAAAGEFEFEAVAGYIFQQHADGIGAVSVLG